MLKSEAFVGFSEQVVLVVIKFIAKSFLKVFFRSSLSQEKIILFVNIFADFHVQYGILRL